MKKFLLLLTVVSLVMGCTYAKLMTAGGKPVILNQPPQQYTVLAHIEKTKQIAFDYTSTPDMASIFRDALNPYPNADAIINVVASIQMTPGDFFLNLFTLGIANAYTMKIEGDVIDYKE